MFFSKLPQHLQREIYLLTKDDQFQHRFSTDKALDDIDAMKYDKVVSFRQSIQVLFKHDIYNDKVIHPLTLGKISLLWYIDNDYFSSQKYIYQADNMATDQFFYVIQTPFQQLSIYDIPSKAYKYVQLQMKIDYEMAKTLAIMLIKIGFSPLKKFSTPNIQGKIQTHYDAVWMTTLAATVHNVSGYDTDYIIQKMPVSEVCFYFVVWKKMNGGQMVQRTEQQILILQDQRAAMLIVEYLIQKGKIKEEQKEHWYNVIITDPDKKCK